MCQNVPVIYGVIDKKIWVQCTIGNPEGTLFLQNWLHIGTKLAFFFFLFLLREHGIMKLIRAKEGTGMATPEELVIAVCDDNPQVLRQVEQLVHRQLKVTPHRLAAFDNARDLLDFARQQPLRLAVLDIRLTEENGIRLAQRLLALQPACRVIFLTAYVAYCQDVYDVDHIAFVLKDEMETRLPVAMTRALAPTSPPAARPAAHPLLTLGKPGAAVQIPQENICYLERNVRATWVRTMGEGVVTPEKLEKLLQLLDPVEFCQTHKSFAVHWTYVERYEKNQLQMADGARVPISRHYAAQVRRSFLAYLASRQPAQKEVLP